MHRYLRRLYDVGAQITSTGPEPEPPVWKIYDAVDRSNGKVGFYMKNILH